MGCCLGKSEQPDQPEYHYVDSISTQATSISTQRQNSQNEIRPVTPVRPDSIGLNEIRPSTSSRHDTDGFNEIRPVISTVKKTQFMFVQLQEEHSQQILPLKEIVKLLSPNWTQCEKCKGKHLGTIKGTGKQCLNPKCGHLMGVDDTTNFYELNLFRALCDCGNKATGLYMLEPKRDNDPVQLQCQKCQNFVQQDRQPASIIVACGCDKAQLESIFIYFDSKGNIKAIKCIQCQRYVVVNKGNKQMAELIREAEKLDSSKRLSIRGGKLNILKALDKYGSDKFIRALENADNEKWFNATSNGNPGDRKLMPLFVEIKCQSSLLEEMNEIKPKNGILVSVGALESRSSLAALIQNEYTYFSIGT